jgi:ATP-dependent protease ClpP protease subunit
MKTMKTLKKSNGANGEIIRSYSPIGFEIPKEPDLVIYIYDEIGDEVDYVEFVHTVRYATKDQHITIHINSPGGNLITCLSIINAMNASEADITTVVDGEAASAAAMIWLAGHNRLIASPHVLVMLHGASSGFNQSKISDITNSAQTTNRMVESLLDDLTDDLLTDDERSDIRKGVDIYITGKDIIKRWSLDQEEVPVDTIDQS